MKIKWFYILVVLVLLIGIRVARNLYNELEIFPLSREDEEMFLEIGERLNSDTGIICVLIPQKIYYRIGEKPQIDVLIINRTDKTIYLPNSLDGSSDLTRLPYCDIEILNSRKRGGFIDIMPNPLVENDLQLLRPNECFNPLNNYKLDIKIYQPDSVLFFKPDTRIRLTDLWLPNGLNARNYLIPKNYKIQFVYSTKDSTFRGWNVSEHHTDFNLDKLDSIPEISIKSNIVILKYRLF